MHSQSRVPISTQAVADFCRRWGIREFALFGSVLRDDFGPASDVDVLVSFAPDSAASLWDWGAMRDELKCIFGRDVDLVSREGLRNPFRRNNILGQREIVYAA